MGKKRKKKSKALRKRLKKAREAQLLDEFVPEQVTTEPESPEEAQLPEGVKKRKKKRAGRRRKKKSATPDGLEHTASETNINPSPLPSSLAMGNPETIGVEE